MKEMNMTKILRSMIIAALLMLSVLITKTLSVPQTVSAAVCNQENPGGAGGGARLSLAARAVAVDSSVERMSVEFVPKQTWGTGSAFGVSSLTFAKADCSNALSGVSYNVNGQQLSINFGDSTRTGAFVEGTDYKNVADGVVVSSASSTYAAATLLLATINQNEKQLISVDIGSEAGWANIYLKQGDEIEELLLSFKIPSDAVSFYANYNNSARMSYNESVFSTAENCSGISGSGEVNVRVLADGNPVDLTAVANQNTECGNYDKTSYDPSTKTASLKWNTEGEAPKYGIKQNGSNKTLSGDYISFVDSLAANPYTGSDGYYMIDNFTSSNSSEQPVYMYVNNYEDGKSTPKDQPYPIAGGIFDFSVGDVDLSNVTLDVSESKNAALAHNLNTVTKDGTFTLFAARNGSDEFVGVCPGATDINAVDTTCGNLYFLKEGETKNGVTASLVTVGATEFWQVEGLTGTGVFSSTIGSIPGVGDAGSAKNTAVYGYIVTAIIIIGVVTSQRKKIAFLKKRR